jgi:hypothetical protein
MAKVAALHCHGSLLVFFTRFGLALLSTSVLLCGCASPTRSDPLATGTLGYAPVATLVDQPMPAMPTADAPAATTSAGPFS